MKGQGKPLFEKSLAKTFHHKTMSGFVNFIEYNVEKKSEGTHKLKRILLIIGYILFVFVLFGLIYASNFIPMGALIPLFTWILVFFTWRYVTVEYEYTLSAGVLSVAVIYGKRKRKDLLSLKISQIKLLAPLNKSFKSQVKHANVKKTYYALSSKESPNAYFALFENESGISSVLYFDACKKLIKIANFYNKTAIIDSDNLTF